MDKLKAKQAGLERRQRRVRGKITGTAERPRLRVTRTNDHIYAQIIDDVAGTTLASASSVDPEVKKEFDDAQQRAGSGEKLLQRKFKEHRSGPLLSGGDIDADWEGPAGSSDGHILIGLESRVLDINRTPRRGCRR